MLREEHMDLFGVNASGVYSVDQAITGNIAGNIIEIDPTIPNWDVYFYCTQDATGGTSVALTVQGANALSGGNLSGAVTVFSKTIALADFKKGLIDKIVLPKGYRYFKAATVNTGTFTAGKIAGICVPEFN